MEFEHEPQETKSFLIMIMTKWKQNNQKKKKTEW